jgi:hypothetical protein
LQFCCCCCCSAAVAATIWRLQLPGVEGAAEVVKGACFRDS